MCVCVFGGGVGVGVGGGGNMTEIFCCFVMEGS